MRPIGAAMRDRIHTQKPTEFCCCSKKMGRVMMMAEAKQGQRPLL
jgi:hypothetical protein